jgi:mRNA interferase MazF
MKRAGQIVVTHFPYSDLSGTGLKAPSILRLSRLAVLEGTSLIGCIGVIGDARLVTLRQRLAAWIRE